LFFFGWLKGKLQQRQFTEADQLFDAVDEMLASLLLDTIEDVSRNSIHRLEEMIELNGDSVEERFSDIENTVLGWAEGR
jgi:hypothetical protein